MKPRERIIRVLEGGEPDKIPLILDMWFQPGIHRELIRRLRCTSKLNLVYWLLLDKLTTFLPNPSRELLIHIFASNYDCHHMATKLGSDAVVFLLIPASPYLSINLREGSYTDFFGAKHYIKNLADWRDERIRAIKSEEDFERFRWPNFDALQVDLIAKFVISRFTNHASFGWLMGPYETAYALRGMTDFLMDIYRNPSFVEKLLDKSTEIGVEAIKKIAETGAEGAMIGDDYGTQTGLMMSPTHFERLIVPKLKKLVLECKKRGLFAVLHSCGNVTKVLDFLVDCQFDAIHPLQPGAMDTFEIIEKYKGKFVPYTGIDVQGLLPRSNPSEIKEYIRKLIRLASPSLILGPTNFITNDTPIENVLAAIEAREAYGQIRTI